MTSASQLCGEMAFLWAPSFFFSISFSFLKQKFPSFSMEGKYKKNLKSKSTHQCCWTINGPVCPYTFNLPTGKLNAASLIYAIKFRYHVCRIKNKNHETICSTDKNWKYIAIQRQHHFSMSVGSKSQRRKIDMFNRTETETVILYFIS